MAITNDNVGNALKGLEDFEEVSLGPNEDKSDLREIDVSDGNVPKAEPSASSALINPEGPQANTEVTPGQRVEGTTPQGVSEVAEIEETGKDMGKVGKALANPAVQKFLGEMGIAFGEGRKNEPGVILGQKAVQGAKGQQVNNLAAKMLKGEEITEEDMRGVDAETLSQARQQSLAQREQQRKEEATEADIEQGKRRLNIDERVNELRKRGIELDEDKFDLTEDATRAEMERADAQLRVKEQQAETEDLLSRAQAQYYRARAESLQNPDDPASKARLLEARNETIGLLNTRLNKETTELRNAQRELESAEGNFLGSTGDFLQALYPGQSMREVQLREELSIEDAQQLVNQKEEQVSQIEETLQNIQEAQTGELGTGDQEDTGAEEDQTNENLGTLDNPIEVSSDAQWRALESGTFFEAEGTTYERVEDGIREVQ